MIALVEGGESFAIHRTYLRPDGKSKANITPNKMMLGGVRLSDTAGPLVVCEGIERGFLPCIRDFAASLACLGRAECIRNAVMHFTPETP